LWNSASHPTDKKPRVFRLYTDREQSGKAFSRRSQKSYSHFLSTRVTALNWSHFWKAQLRFVRSHQICQTRQLQRMLMIARQTWRKILITAGGIAMAVGAVNPLGGALVLLAGAALFAIGSFVGKVDRRGRVYRVAVLCTIAFGVAAAAALTSRGGFGGTSGRSIWWGVLVLPILIGWSMGICGPGSPRWLLLLGIAVSVFHLAVAAIVLAHPGRSGGPLAGLVLGATGVATIGGCVTRLKSAARQI
jgi:uncharacterized membrane protein YiaA